MKKIYSCFIILTFFASCADDENTAPKMNTPKINKGGSEILPMNAANPYDNAGRIYDEIFDVYYNGTSRSSNITSVISQVEAIASTNTLFNGINSGHQPLSAERIEYLAGRNSTSISGLVGASGLSATAKVGFGNFLIIISDLYEVATDATIMYNSVLKYEETVIDNELLTANDRRVILTTTSIIRYSAYRAKKKPKKNTDPYWNIWITHALAGEEGAEENVEKAILQSLVTGIVSNK